MIEKTNIFQAQVNYGKYQDFITKFTALAEERVPSYVLFMNSHMIHEYHHSESFQPVVKNASFICPDGVPLLKSLKYINKVNSERVAGNDMIFSLLDKASKNNLKVVFYGSTEEILAAIDARLNDQYAGLQRLLISPPFRELSQEEIDAYIDEINSFEPNMIFVGLGCPKQEKWMYDQREKLKAPMFGLGGAFLLFANVDSRAPKLLRDLGLEWTYRLVLEPRRLFKRYLVTNSYFIRLFIKAKFWGGA